MARLFKAKKGMGAVKVPGKKARSVVKKIAKAAIKKGAKATSAKAKAKAVATGGKKRGRKSDPSKWQKRKGFHYVKDLSPGAIRQRIAKGHQKHPVAAKKAKPALPMAIKARARKYFNATRKSNPKLRVYDKVRNSLRRDILEKKTGRRSGAFYQHGMRAGRRPRIGSKVGKYATGPKKRKAKTAISAKKTAAKKSSKKTTSTKRSSKTVKRRAKK